MYCDDLILVKQCRHITLNHVCAQIIHPRVYLCPQTLVCTHSERAKRQEEELAKEKQKIETKRKQEQKELQMLQQRQQKYLSTVLLSEIRRQKIEEHRQVFAHGGTSAC